MFTQPINLPRPINVTTGVVGANVAAGKGTVTTATATAPPTGF